MAVSLPVCSETESNRFCRAVLCISAAYACSRVFHLQSFSLNWGTFAPDRFSRNRRRKTVAPPRRKKNDASTNQSKNFGVSYQRFKPSMPGSSSTLCTVTAHPSICEFVCTIKLPSINCPLFRHKVMVRSYLKKGQSHNRPVPVRRIQRKLILQMKRFVLLK